MFLRPLIPTVVTTPAEPNGRLNQYFLKGMYRPCPKMASTTLMVRASTLYQLAQA